MLTDVETDNSGIAFSKLTALSLCAQQLTKIIEKSNEQGFD